MEKNPFKWPIAVIAGILVLVTDLFFNLNAILLWPTNDFSPFTNYHSDLGLTKSGPRGHNSALGAQYYNCGQVFQGLAVIFFASFPNSIVKGIPRNCTVSIAPTKWFIPIPISVPKITAITMIVPMPSL